MLLATFFQKLGGASFTEYIGIWERTLNIKKTLLFTSLLFSFLPGSSEGQSRASIQATATVRVPPLLMITAVESTEVFEVDGNYFLFQIVTVRSNQEYRLLLSSSEVTEVTIEQLADEAPTRAVISGRQVVSTGEKGLQAHKFRIGLPGYGNIEKARRASLSLLYTLEQRNY